MTIFEATYELATALVVIVIALVQLIKMSLPQIPKNLIPLVSVIVGVIFGALAHPFTELDLTLRLWAGIFAGLAATGLFETVFNPRTGDNI